MSALVTSLCFPALPTKSTTRHDGLALAAIAARRASAVSGPSTTPGSGRVDRPTICEYSDRLFVGRPMMTTSTPGSSKPSVSTPQLHTTCSLPAAKSASTRRRSSRSVFAAHPRRHPRPMPVEDLRRHLRRLHARREHQRPPLPDDRQRRRRHLLQVLLRLHHGGQVAAVQVARRSCGCWNNPAPPRAPSAARSAPASRRESRPALRSRTRPTETPGRAPPRRRGPASPSRPGSSAPGCVR